MLKDDFSPMDQTPRPGAPSEIEQLRALLYTDDLTGLYNRRFFRHCVSEQKSQSDSTGSPFALLMMDVDHFKQINDTYGHGIGDAALIRIAKVLKEELRDKGWVFRYAGDEFAAILRDSSEENARTICSHLLQKVSTCLDEQESSFPLKTVSLSIGFALYPDDCPVISELIAHSDRALYASKEAGRNCFHSAREITAGEKEEAGQWPIKVYCQSLIGRQQQWSQLLHYFSDCRNSYGRLVLLNGEAGIGKSRLLRQFCRRQRAGDYHILFGECTEGTIIHSYAPVRDALRKGFEAADPATVNVYKEMEVHYRRELVSLVPQFDRFEKQPVAAPQTTSDRYFLLESILTLLQGLSRQLPTIMVLEDIHWSDEATLNLLQYLSRNIRNERILLLATFRSEEAMHSALPSILQNMTRENLFETITLKPLSAEETGQMLDEIFRGYTLSPSLKQWMHDETEGIPFYIEELLKLMLEEDYIQRYERDIELRKPDKFVLPYSIRALIQRRIGRLGEPLQRLLGYAGIIGYEFDLNILVRLIEENEGYLLDLLEQLTRMQMIREISAGGEERFAFAHNKIRDVIYEDMGLIKRKKFHRRVAEILEATHAEDLPLYAEDLAYHFEQGGMMEKAFKYSLEAGKKALQIHAYQDADAHFDRCLHYRDLLESCPPESTVELLTSKGQTLEALGCWDQAIQCYEQLLNSKEASGGVTHIDGLNHLSRIFYRRENFQKSVSLAEQALRLARENKYEQGICSSYYNLGKNYWRLCNYDEALHYVTAAIEMTPVDMNAAQRARFVNSAGIIHLEKSDFAQASRCFQDALELFQANNDKPGVIECLVNISIIRQLQGNLQEARQHIINAFVLAQEMGDPASIAACSVNQAELELRLGNYEMANRLNERAGRIYNELNHNLGQTYYLQNEGSLSLINGNLEAAMEAFIKARGIADESSLKKRVTELAREEALVHYLEGNYADAITCLDQSLHTSISIGDSAGLAEAYFKMGYLFFVLDDIPNATVHWKKALKTDSALLTCEMLFYRAAFEGLLATVEHREQEARSLQNEMRMIARKTEAPLLATISGILASYQSQLANRTMDALRFAEEAEKNAFEHKQMAWLPRIGIRLLELKNTAGMPVTTDDVNMVFVAARQQRQNEIMHRCFKLLSQIEPNFDAMQPAWKQHWESWKSMIPLPYHRLFQID